MLRLFERHQIRQVRELEGDWDFQPIEEGVGLPSQYTYRLPVPGCWENHPKFSTYRGKGAYRTILKVENAGALRLVFKGVSHTGEVFLDGVKLGEHYNAYTPFDIVVPHMESGLHELAVIVDNTFNKDSALHVPNDYYTYGGIIRPVAVEFVPNTFIERVEFIPLLTNLNWSARIIAYVRNSGENESKIQIKGNLHDHSIDFGSKVVKPGETAIFSINQEFPHMIAWSSEEPKLYMLELLLLTEDTEEPVDDLIERVGFRTVTTDGGRIQINRKDILLKGFNRHEDHPMVGAAIPYPLMVQDLELMLDMGANSVRTSHYPNDERFLDLCDERGVYVWEENHARGLTLEQMQHPLFEKQCEDCNREMVESHYNHPCIIIWAILNECASDTSEGKEMYHKQLSQIRSIDASRPLTFASDKRDRELCFELADIVSFNLYPLWYGDEDPGALMSQARQWADASGGMHKPMIMSEFGADGYYGLRDPSRVKGTEERQCDILERNLEAYTSSSTLSGMFIWQFCDCRVTEGTGWLLARAGTQNSKGVVDRYRRPKLAYSTIKQYFST